MNNNPPPGDFDPPPRPHGNAASDGVNPFRDDANVTPLRDNSTPSDNLYAGPAGPFPRPTDTQNYDATLPHRGTVVFAFGLVGLLGATLGSLGLFCCLPFPMFALAISVPAWLMGRMDLIAMKAGAMDNRGRTATYRGYAMGIIATVIASAICLGFGGWIIWDLWQNR